MLLHDPALADEREPLSSVAIATGLMIQNARLQVQLTARLEELKGLGHASSTPSDGVARLWSGICTTARSSGWSDCP